ncbi:MAG: cell division protein FtsX [Rubricoccaceae bacterium]
MSLAYTFREGLAGFRRARLATATSVSALAVALVLIGLFVLIGWQWNRAANELRQRAGEVEVFLDPLDALQTARLRERLESLPGVDTVRYVSREEAVQVFRETFGEAPDLFEGELFLPASFRVRFRGDYAQADSLEQVARRIESWGRVQEATFDAPLLDVVERNRRVFSGIGLAMGLLVVAAALLLVGNTVRLSIYARRMLIRTMKLVGATNGFIRRPFLIEGLVQGFVAGVVAAVLLWLLYGLLLGSLAEADALPAAASGWPGGTPVLALAALVVLGLVLGLLASWVAVRQFIRRVPLS